MFVRRNRKACERIVGDFQTGRSWPCDCEGFRPIDGALADASFAVVEEQVPELPALRLARRVDSA